MTPTEFAKVCILIVGVIIIVVVALTAGCSRHNICTDPNFDVQVPEMCHAGFNRE